MGTTVTFGEQMGGGPTVACQFSMTNPGYSGSPDDQAHDWAFCVLPEPVEMPTTPIMFGCELSGLEAGGAIAIAGFGQTDTGMSGVKHWNHTVLNSVDLNLGVVTLGGMGEASVCPGDSGGPAFFQFPDGSWHAFGIASTVTGGCGGYGTHGMLSHAVPWFEQESGLDVTPCHDVDGNADIIEQPWIPTPQCGNFYAGEAGMGYGTWNGQTSGNVGCEGTPLLPISASCGPGFAGDDDEPPIVEIVSPTDGQTFGEPIEAETGGDPEDCLEYVTTTVDVTDNSEFVRSVKLRIDCDHLPELCPFEVPELLGEPWVFANAGFPQGQFRITAIAEDFSGNIAESETVGIGVCAEAPAPEDEDGTGDDAGQDEDGGKGCGCSTDGRTGQLPAALLSLGLLAFVRRRHG
jgi:MYXO-CTERM domain-containing protein